MPTDGWYLQYLACPDCGLSLPPPDREARCPCGFARRVDSQLDLRPDSPRERAVSFRLFTRARELLASAVVAPPEPTYSGPRAQRDSFELFSAVQGRLFAGDKLLDLGCGPRDQAIPARHLGLQYVGVDVGSAEADLLADAHALPFRDGSFDFVLSYAVLEHLYNPFLAAKEVCRVLRPGGIFFGTVAQGEPFHDSYFHHTAWGLLQVLDDAGFRITRLWSSYDTLQALATMGRYSRVGRWLLSALDGFLRATPALSPRKHFRWSAEQKRLDAIYRAASLCFVATSTGSGSAS